MSLFLRKQTSLSLSSLSSRGRFEGYASLFNITDLGKDVVVKGAFLMTLRQKNAIDIKMLWQHHPQMPLGIWLALQEDAAGLRVKGQLNLGLARGRKLLACLENKSVDGLSIGFYAQKAALDAQTGIRYLHEISLVEISLVTSPMLPQARISTLLP